MSFIEVLGFTINVIGEFFLGMSVYFVHRQVAKEKKIDLHFTREFRRERVFALLGIVFIILGYILQLPAQLE
ncbi:hypothetical protein HY495_01745 [Candidatus Woesearchaeota archaeon]|nr:hypothetical protein [Candidatus Woesearchaeota archaeon]